jgi:hypothetical protein
MIKEKEIGNMPRDFATILKRPQNLAMLNDAGTALFNMLCDT